MTGTECQKYPLHGVLPKIKPDYCKYGLCLERIYNPHIIFSLLFHSLGWGGREGKRDQQTVVFLSGTYRVAAHHLIVFEASDAHRAHI